MYHILISSAEQEELNSKFMKINMTGMITNYYNNQAIKPDIE